MSCGLCLDVLQVHDRSSDNMFNLLWAGGKVEYYLGSADWMTRNLTRRVEVVTPVEDESLQKELQVWDVLHLYHFVCKPNNLPRENLYGADFCLRRHYEEGTEGPLYTMAKGCDHEVVRALETYPEAIPWKFEIEFCVVMELPSVL